MKIKVCGLRYPENINEVAVLQPDYVGFIFYPQSPRFVGEFEAVDVPAIKTGLFVNEEPEHIAKLIAQHKLAAIQLHGSEDPEFCERFKGKVTVIKAFGIDENFEFEQLNEFEDSVDYFLFDTKTSKHGGSGQTFAWNLLDRYKLSVPFLLSGGLSLENLDEVKKIRHPQFYGVDLNSRFEIEPGLKDIDKLTKAFKILR